MPLLRSPIVWAILGGSLLLYVILYLPGCNGYGYAGYGGYHRSPSYFYWGGAQTYHNRNIRAGSRGGASARGGGPHGGK